MNKPRGRLVNEMKPNGRGKWQISEGQFSQFSFNCLDRTQSGVTIIHVGDDEDLRSEIDWKQGKGKTLLNGSLKAAEFDYD